MLPLPNPSPVGRGTLTSFLSEGGTLILSPNGRGALTPSPNGGGQGRGERPSIDTLSQVPARLAALRSQRGVSLIELIMFIVIVSGAIAGILPVMNLNTRHSADPLIHKQALATAESLLEEIELKAFSKPVGGFTGPFTLANRSLFDTVSDYNGFSSTGIYAVDGTTLVVPNYAVAVTESNSGFGGIPAASSVLITVTVTDPTGASLSATGYKVDY